MSFLRKVILSFVLGAAAILDGSYRTVMIAGKTGAAVTLMFPLRQFSFSVCHVASDACLNALSTADAFVGIHTEWLVADEQPVEDRA